MSTSTKLQLRRCNHFKFKNVCSKAYDSTACMVDNPFFSLVCEHNSYVNYTHMEQ